MNNNFIISELKITEINSICELFQLVFSTPIHPEQWVWKYQNGPRLGSLNMVAHDFSGKLVGHVGASVFAGVYDKKPIAMVQICDVMVDKNSRNAYSLNSIYPSLMKAMQAELNRRFELIFVYGFVGIRPFNLGNRLGFYRQIRPYQYQILDINSSKDYRDILLRVESSDWDLVRLDTVWKRRLNEQQRPILSRTSDYMLWRYKTNPVNTYKLWIVNDLFFDTGWFVTREMPNGEICIIDSLIPENVYLNRYLNALRVAINKIYKNNPAITGWIGLDNNEATSNSNISIEIRITDWWPQLKDPLFQPGDTDVY